MNKILISFVLIIFSATIAYADCENGVEKVVSSAQAGIGAVLVTGAIAGGAFAGTAIAKNNNASDGGSILMAAGTAVVSGAVVGFVYNAILDIFSLKEEKKCGGEEQVKEETPDFMFEKRN